MTQKHFHIPVNMIDSSSSNSSKDINDDMYQFLSLQKGFIQICLYKVKDKAMISLRNVNTNNIIRLTHDEFKALIFLDKTIQLGFDCISSVLKLKNECEHNYKKTETMNENRQSEPVFENIISNDNIFSNISDFSIDNEPSESISFSQSNIDVIEQAFNISQKM
jgi:hypothetical protein